MTDLTWRPGSPAFKHLYYADGARDTYILSGGLDGRWYLTSYSRGTDATEFGRRISVLEAAALRIPVAGYTAGAAAALFLEDHGYRLADLLREPGLQPAPATPEALTETPPADWADWPAWIAGKETSPDA